MEKSRPVVHVWTDGSTLPINPGPGGWAAVLRLKKGNEYVKEKIISGSSKWASNIRMETVGALRALQYLKVPSIVIIHTDSQYIVDGFKRLTRNQLLKSHYDIWGLLLHYSQIHHVHLKKVKGHSGVEGNELADKYAKEAAKGQAGDLFMSESEEMMESVRQLKKLDDTEL